jgi:predicted nucleic acid-binding protein
VIVVDASVVANAVADDGADGRVARALIAGTTPLAAPDLVDVETVSVLRRRWLAGHLTPARFAGAVEDLNSLDISRYATGPLMMRAYELRDNITPYDAAYVALAEALDAPLLTADRRLAQAPGPRCEIRLVTR